MEGRVPKGAKGSKGAKGAKGNKDTKVTRYIGSKGLLGDKVFSRTCVRSSLTPEEGPSCFLLYCLNDQMTNNLICLIEVNKRNIFLLNLQTIFKIRDKIT